MLNKFLSQILFGSVSLAMVPDRVADLAVTDSDVSSNLGDAFFRKRLVTLPLGVKSFFLGFCLGDVSALVHLEVELSYIFSLLKGHWCVVGLS